MERQTRISSIADRVIEGGWLLVLVMIPYFFNLVSARHFEPDKATALRAIVLVMLAAWAIKTMERVTVGGEKLRWAGWRRAPLAIPVWTYVGVFFLATVLSVAPGISWWGGYNRLQGTYTNLSYIALFALIIGNLRTRPQLERIITTTILTAVGVAVYGLLQHADIDPLPWRGDTAARIASTMGNSIFVAAYLIMVIPFVLMRLSTAVSGLSKAKHNGSADGVWLVLFVLAIVAQQAFLVGQIKFGAAVRTQDFRYAWVFPAALAVVTASFALVSVAQSRGGDRRLPIFTLAASGTWVILLAVYYLVSRSAQQLDPNPRVADWGLWTLGGLVGIGICAAGMLFLPRREAADGRIWLGAQVAGYATVLGVLLVAVFFSQSRGPQLGLLAALVLFVDLLLLRRWRAARQIGSPSTRRWLVGLSAAGALQAVGIAFLLIFNLSQAPVFERLRSVPYVGRFGELLEVNDGTGRVRTLIWFGDDVAKGAVGLILSNPFRTIVGYGPETMFTVYNPFYPPELARYEARGASPDRSHQAELDELVTKGVLGLVSYFFLMFSALWLGWKLFWRSQHGSSQLLYLACIATLIAHLIEGLSGIPIVSTLMMVWVTLGLLVGGGLLEGLLHLAPVVAAPVTEPEPVVVATPAKPRPKTPRNAQPVRGMPRASATSQKGAFRWMYLPIMALALVGIWFWNIKVIYADMHYNLAQSSGGNDLNAALGKYIQTLEAVELAPDEDYYYLQLGSSLIQLAYNYKLRGAQDNQVEQVMAAPRPNQSFEDLFRGASLEAAAVNTYNTASVPQMLEYARKVLEQAQNLSPYNKDHPANLGRLHALWYQLTGDQTKLQTAVDWFAKANVVAPNDVVIITELATNLAQFGTDRHAEAEQLFLRAQTLDPRYAESYLRLGNLYRLTERPVLAGGEYGKALRQYPLNISESTEPTFDRMIADLRATPEALTAVGDGLRGYIANERSEADLATLPKGTQDQLRTFYSRAHANLGRVSAALNDNATVESSFAQALVFAPNNVLIHQQYTLALSDTLQYAAALRRAEEGLRIAKTQAETDRFNQLIAQIQQRIGGGR